MGSRAIYTALEERRMWEHVFLQLQAGNEAAFQPKGLKLWQCFERKYGGNKSACSLATHFRRLMYDHIEDAAIDVEKLLYIASQLQIPLSRRQQKIIEYKSRVSIIVNDFRVVTEYRKDGKRYIPSLLRKKTPSEDTINDESEYDAFDLPDGVRSLDDTTAKNNKPAPENAMISNEQQSSANDIITEDVNGIRKVDAPANASHYNLRRFSENRKVTNETDSLNYKLCNSNVVTVCPENIDDVSDSGNEIELVDDVEVKLDSTAVRESSASEMMGKAAEEKDFSSDSKKCLEKNVDVIPEINIAYSIMPRRKRTIPSAVDGIIDDELKEMLAQIETKAHLKGVEKFKMEKILELRAEEAKRLGIGLRNYLKKIRQEIERSDVDPC